MAPYAVGRQAVSDAAFKKMVYTTLQFANTNTTCRHFNGSGRFPRKIGKLQ